MPRVLVSVVIPTRGRSALVCRAIDSVIRQTVRELEIIVVIDGPDPATVERLAGIGDPRVCVVSLRGPQGPSAARNFGIDRARGEWIAFLDDDDEWLPEKLSRQLEAARNSMVPLPVISCRAIIDTPTGTYCWPSRTPRAGEHVSEYLYVRRSPFTEGYLPTPALMAPRALFRRVRFDESLWFHEDWDWLLRAGAESGCAIVVVFEPLCIVHAEGGRPSLSVGRDWRSCLNWGKERRAQMTLRAYAAFCLIPTAGAAARQRAWRAFPWLLWEAFRRGRPTVMGLLIYLSLWTLSPRIRHAVRRLHFHGLSSPARGIHGA
jgi:glycosyltransferase involved in cell wall biosynthesis